MMATDVEKKAFGGKLAKWLAGIDDEDQKDWAEALLAASLDVCGGQLEPALEMAMAKFEEDPDGGSKVAPSNVEKVGKGGEA